MYTLSPTSAVGTLTITNTTPGQKFNDHWTELNFDTYASGPRPCLAVLVSPTIRVVPLPPRLLPLALPLPTFLPLMATSTFLDLTSSVSSSKNWPNHFIRHCWWRHTALRCVEQIFRVGGIRPHKPSQKILSILCWRLSCRARVLFLRHKISANTFRIRSDQITVTEVL